MNIAIDHPKAATVSVVNHTGTYSDGDHSEIAFFDADDKWVTDVIAPFRPFFDGVFGDTAVYAFVPNFLIDEFLDEFGATQ